MKRLLLSRTETRVLIYLWFGCIAGSLLVLPYLIHLFNLPMQTIPTRALKTIMNALVIFPLPLYIGMKLKNFTPLAGVPYLEGIKPIDWRDLLRWGVVSGLIAWLLICTGDLFFSRLSSEVNLMKSQEPSAFYGFLASFYGGIVEEVSLRLFFLTLLVWTVKKLGDVGIWTAIISAAVIFGALHLPTTAKALGLASITQLSALLVVREIILNAVVGVICGWLYWRRGLEYAILSHFSADLGLHVIQPFFR